MEAWVVGCYDMVMTAGTVSIGRKGDSGSRNGRGGRRGE